MAAHKIFISYRRADARADARSLNDRLCRAFGDRNVFMDVNDLMVGTRFDRELEKALESCDVFIAVIGPNWLDILNNRRRSGERDYVREEITGAIAQDKIVIPVLIEDTTLPPPAELPNDMQSLALFQAHPITHARFGRDVDDLVTGIKAARKARRGPGLFGWSQSSVKTASKPAQDPRANQPQRQSAAATPASQPAPPAPQPEAAAQPPRAPAKSGGSTWPVAAAVGAVVLVIVGGLGYGYYAFTQGGIPDLSASKPVERTVGRIPTVSPKGSSRPSPSARRAPLPAIPADAFDDVTPATWKVQSGFPAQGAWEDTIKGFGRRVERASKRRLKIEPLPVNSVAPTFELFDAVAKGNLDGAFTFLEYARGRDPALALLSNPPFGFRDAEAAARWRRTSEVRRITDDILRRQGLKSIPCGGFSNYGALWSRQPITAAGDLKGLKVRSFNLASDARIAAGISTVFLPGSEVYPALQRGVIDATDWASLQFALDLGLPDVTKYVYAPGVLRPGPIVDLIINLTTWRALPEAAQAGLEGVCAHNLAAAVEMDRRRTVKTLDKNWPAGLPLKPLPRSVLAVFRDTSSAVLEKFGAKSKQTRQLVDLLRLAPADDRITVDWASQSLLDLTKRGPLQ